MGNADTNLFAQNISGLCIHEIIYDKNREAVDYIILAINPSYAKTLNISREQAVKARASELFGDEKPSFLDIYSRVVETGIAEEFQASFPHIEKDLHIKAFAIGESKFATAILDLTAEDRAEQAVKHLNDILRAIRNINHLIVTEKDRERLLQGACKELVRNRGYYNAWIVLLDEDKQFVMSFMEGLGEDFIPLLEKIKLGGLSACGQRALKKNGVEVIPDPPADCGDCPLATTYAGRGAMTVRLEHEGHVYGLLAVSNPSKFITDVDEHKLFQEVANNLGFALYSIELDEIRTLNEETLRMSETRYKAVVEHSHDGILIVGEDYGFEYVNDKLCEILARRHEEIIGHDFREFLDEESHRLVSERYVKRQRGEDVPPLYEFNILREDGEKRCVEISTAIVLDYDGKAKTIAQIKDITDQKLSEEALQESEEKHRKLIEITSEGFWFLDSEYKTIDVNQSLCNMLGYSRNEILGKTPFEFVDAENEKILTDQISHITSTLHGTYEISLKNKKGNNISTLINATSYVDNNEKLAGSFAFVTNITERVQKEEVIKRYSERMQALNKIVIRLIKEFDLNELVKLIVSQAVHLVGGIAGCYNELSSDGKILDLNYHAGYDTLPVDTTIKRGEGLVGSVWSAGETIIVDDYAAWGDRAQKWVEHYGHAALIGVPVKHQEDFFGVIEVKREPGKIFSEEDKSLLELFANQTAVAIHNVNLFDRSNRRLKRLKALREIEETISSSLDLNLTLNILIKQLIENLNVDAGDILLHNCSLGTLEYITGWGFRTDALQHAQLRIGEGQAGRAALNRRIVHIPDLTQETMSLDRAKKIRLEDFITYFGIPLIAKGEVVGVLEVFNRVRFDPSSEWFNYLETLAGQAANAIDRLNLFDDLQISNINLSKANNDVITGWSRALELRDLETQGHSARVEKLTMKIARKLGVMGKELNYIRQGALLHDIGKIGVPDSILLKPAKLTDEEWEIMKKHPAFAYEMLSPIEHLRPAIDIPYCHHEKWDGTGYPRGLKGEDIPLSARIFAVVDVWDALRSDRPYRKAWSDEKALDYIKEQPGKHFDPQVVAVLLDIFGEK